MKNRIGAGTPGSSLGISGAGEERTAGAGRGGGERRAVHGVASPATPLQGYLHESARSCAGAPGKGRLVFVDGEGVPSPAPPRVISPRSSAWDDTGEEQDRGRLPGLAPHPGYLHDIPRSCAGALGKGRYGSPRRGGGSLPGPSPG